MEKKSGLGNFAADVLSLGYRAPAYALKKTVGFAGDFGSRLTNNIRGDARKVSEGLEMLGGSSGGAAARDAVRVRPEPTSAFQAYVRHMDGGIQKYRSGNVAEGLGDILEGGTKATEELSPKLKSVIDTLRPKKKPNYPLYGALGVGGAAAAVAASAANSEKSAGVLSLKTKLKLALGNGKPKVKDMLIGGAIGAGAGLVAKNASVATMIGKGFGAAQRGFSKLNPFSGNGRGISGFMRDANMASKGVPDHMIGVTSPAARNRYTSAAGRAEQRLKKQEFRKQTIGDEFKQYERQMGRAAKQSNPIEASLRTTQMHLPAVAGKILPDAVKNNPMYSTGLAIAGGAAAKWGKGMLEARAMNNAVKKWAPPVATGLGGYMLFKGNGQEKQAMVNPITAAREVLKRVRMNAKTRTPALDSYGNPVYRPQIVNGVPVKDKVEQVFHEPMGTAKAINTEFKHLKDSYGTTFVAAGITAKAGKKLFDFGRAHYLARKAAQREAKEMKMIAGLGVGAIGATVGLNAYNAHVKEAGAKETAIAKILARTPRATSVEEALAHWAGKREAQVAHLDAIGEKNVFNAFKHNRASRALEEAEGNLETLHLSTMMNGGVANAPTAATGVTLKGVALGAGAGALGMAAYAKKQRDAEDAQQVPDAQFFYRNRQVPGDPLLYRNRI